MIIIIKIIIIIIIIIMIIIIIIIVISGLEALDSKVKQRVLFLQPKIKVCLPETIKLTSCTMALTQSVGFVKTRLRLLIILCLVAQY